MTTFKFTVLFLFSFLIAKAQVPTILIKEKQTVVIVGSFYFTTIHLINTPFDEVDYYFSNTLLPKDSTGAGILKFKCSPGVYDQTGQARKQYTLTAKYKENGKSFVLVQDFTYTVKQPELFIDAPMKSTFYKNCGNEIFVRCPELENLFQPYCTVSGASIIRGSQRGKNTIIPTDSVVLLYVNNQGTRLATKEFISIPPPAPTILVEKDSIELSTNKSISNKGKISIQIIPDTLFARLYKYDARYQIKSWDLTVLRNNKELITKNFQQADADLSSLDVKLVSGDSLIVTIKEVNRINFLSQVYPEKSAQRTFMTRIF